MQVTVQGVGSVKLSQSDFVATGGQASVWVKGGTAYKVYTDPKDAIPAAKFDELAAIADSGVVRPKALLLGKKNEPLGYAMDAVPESHSLCQLFVPAFQQREKIDQKTIHEVASLLMDRVRSVHRAEVLVVDLNELNVLVSKKFDQVFLIDVDSFQTKHFPAPVILPSVRDWSAGSRFTRQSDWYSYAVLAFQLLVGAHPYKGSIQHPEIASVPKDQRLEWRMKRHLSAFRPGARLPACCAPFEDIPKEFRQWLVSELDEGKRSEPPGLRAAPVLVIPAPKPLRALASSGDLELELVSRGAWSLLVAYVDGGLSLYREGSLAVVKLAHREWGGDATAELESGQVLLGTTPKLKKPVALRQAGGSTTLYDFERQERQLLPMRLDEIAKAGDRFLGRMGSFVHEIDFRESAQGLHVLLGRRLADVLPKASRLFEGCVVQDVLGSSFVSLFPRPGEGHQKRLRDLDGRKVLDAKFQCFPGGGVLMVLAARGGKYDRFVFRWDDDYTTCDVRRVEDVSPGLVNFVVTDSGVAVCLDEEDRLEVFRANGEHPALRIVESPLLGGDLRLCRVQGGVGFTRGSELYRLRLK